MTNEEILKKVIERAKGYKYGCIIFPEVFEDKRYYSKIFSHSFAKAFWGDSIKNICHNCGIEGFIIPNGVYCGKCKVTHRHEGITHWQHHLQQMVLEEEPLKYLEKFLK